MAVLDIFRRPATLILPCCSPLFFPLLREATFSAERALYRPLADFFLTALIKLFVINVLFEGHSFLLELSFSHHLN